MTWRVFSAEPDALGESPFWHPGERCLYWIDIDACAIHRADETGARERWIVPQNPGCIAPAAGGGLVLALRDGIYRAQTWGGPLRRLIAAPYDVTHTRFNDGKCDPLGRFWAGTMFEPRTAPSAALYAFDGRAGHAPTLQEMAAQATISNGLAWSPDRRTVYWADTPAHAVRCWDWDAAANRLSRPRVFHQFAPKPVSWRFGPGSFERYRGRPDGAAVDAEGHYWVAMMEGQRLCKIAPDGRVLAEVRTPVLRPTMPCFGGPDLRTLYLTTLRPAAGAADLAAQPEAGCVFAMEVDTPGLPVNFFEDN